jgi:hypothetical protein
LQDAALGRTIVGVEDEPPFDWDLEEGLILLLMRIDAKLDLILSLYEEEDDGDEEAEP